MDSKVIEIENRSIGAGKPCFIIGEVAQSHDGSLGMAHAFVDAISKTGADAIKFQTHIAEAESSPSEPWRVKFSYQDKSRFDYWKRMEFTKDEWIELKRHAESLGLVFLSSAFSNEAVSLLDSLGMQAWKVASGEVSNKMLLEKICLTKKPIIFSSGLSTIDDISDAVSYVSSRHVQYAILQCTTSYPTPPELVGLNIMENFRKLFNCPTGLSDHSGTQYPGFAAATLGANILELHVTLSKEMFGPDVIASITTSELAQLVEGVRFIEHMNANPVDKNQLAKNFVDLKKIFLKSIVAAHDIPAGTFLQKSDLVFLKPGTGIGVDKIDKVIGRRLLVDIEQGEKIKFEHLATNDSTG